MAKMKNANTWLLDRHPSKANELLRWYGGFISKHPVFFLVIPVLLAGICAGGLFKLARLDNTDLSLWVAPKNGEKHINDPGMKVWFEEDWDNVCGCKHSAYADCQEHVPERCSEKIEDKTKYFGCNQLQIVLISKNGNNLLETDALADIIRLDQFFTFEHYEWGFNDDHAVLYADETGNRSMSLCLMRDDGSCVQFSSITTIRDVMLKKVMKIDDIEEQNTFLRSIVLEENKEEFDSMLEMRPDFRYPFAGGHEFIGLMYGGVRYIHQNESWRNNVRSGRGRSAHALRMFYCFDPSKTEETKTFLESAVKAIDYEFGDNPNFEIYTLSSWSVPEANERELGKALIKVLFCLLVCLIFVFIASYVTGGARTGKPWFAVIGVLFQLLAIAATLGLFGWTDFAIPDFSVILGLMLLANGIGDVFEMLCEWSSTKPRYKPHHRLRHVMHVSAYSIVVVAIANILSFALDTAFVAAPIIKAFSTVAAIGLFFQAIINLTALPALLVLFGRMQHKDQHSCCCCFKLTNNCIFCMESRDRDYDDHVIWLASQRRLHKHSRHWPVVSQAEEDPWFHYSPLKDALEKNFIDFVNKPAVAVVILVSFLFYAAMCGYCCSQIEVGLKRSHLAPAKRDGPNDIEVVVDNFPAFSFEIEIYIKDSLNYVHYWLEDDRNLVPMLIEDIHAIKNIAPRAISRNWFDDFENYTSSRNIDVSTRDTYISVLRNQFFADKKTNSLLLLDVGFEDMQTDDDSAFTVVGISRFLVWAVDIDSQEKAAAVVEGLRTVARRYASRKLEVVFYSKDLESIEPMLDVTMMTVWLILVHYTVITAISLIAWNRPIGTLLMGLSPASLFLGIISLSLAWDIQLDPVSCTCIIATASFTISFPAKMTSALIDADSVPVKRRFRRKVAGTLVALLNTALATIVIILGLSTCPIYLVSSAFKFTFVGIMLACYHCFFILLLIIYFLRVLRN